MNEPIVGCALLAGRTGHEAGRALLAALYAQHVGGPMPEIVTGSRGKPEFARGPWHFSITHTPRRAFCALSLCPIGIDAEEADRKIFLRLAEKILSPGEYTQFLQAPDREKALLTFWVLKEAAAKCTGEGLRGYPCHTDFRLDDPRVSLRDSCYFAIITQKKETF